MDVKKSHERFFPDNYHDIIKRWIFQNVNISHKYMEYLLLSSGIRVAGVSMTHGVSPFWVPVAFPNVLRCLLNAQVNRLIHYSLSSCPFIPSVCIMMSTF